MSWHFTEKPVGHKAREAIQGEFFQDQAIDDAVDALIRETVQNSLDARSGSAPVRLVFSLGRLSAEKASSWFPAEAQAHFAAKEIGLPSIPEWGGEDCCYLTIEDFGTKGLEGQIDSEKPESGGGFYHFFRAEGVSNKGAGSRGSWGVGKIVIPAASRIRAFFAMTRRAGDAAPHVMGQAVLRYHSINGKEYIPDAWFGAQRSDGLQMPFSDARQVASLCYDFRLDRRKDLTGLSLVIPWVDRDLGIDSLASSIAAEYFYPVLSGDLVVEMIDHVAERRIIFDHGSRKEMAGFLGKKLDPEVIELVGSMFSSIDPALLSVRAGSSAASVTYDWADYTLSLPAAEVTHALESGRGVHVRVSSLVRGKGWPAAKSGYFDLLLMKKDGRHAPVYIRDGLLVPNGRRKSLAGYVAVINIGSARQAENPLADALRLSECPAHTDWNSRRDRFKGQFDKGPSLITFVRDSAAKVLGLLMQDDGVPDLNLLADLLPVPRVSAPERAGGGKATGKPAPVSPPPGDVPDVNVNRARCWRLQQSGQGVDVRGNADGFRSPTGYELVIRAAYDLPGRNPLKAHTKHDFDLGVAARKEHDATGFEVVLSDGISIVGTGAAGEMKAHVTRPDFRISLRPADTNRDLYVSVSSSVLGDDDPDADEGDAA